MRWPARPFSASSHDEFAKFLSHRLPFLPYCSCLIQGGQSGASSYTTLYQLQWLLIIRYEIINAFGESEAKCDAAALGMALLKKRTLPQLDKFSAFYRTSRFISAHTTARHLSTPSTTSIQYTLTSCFLNTHFDIILSSTFRSSKWSPSCILPQTNPLPPCTFLFSPPYMPNTPPISSYLTLQPNHVKVSWSISRYDQELTYMHWNRSRDAARQSRFEPGTFEHKAQWFEPRYGKQGDQCNANGSSFLERLLCRSVIPDVSKDPVPSETSAITQITSQQT